MSPVIGMRIGGIIDRLLKLYRLLDLLGDIRVHRADHDGGKAVPVHVDAGYAELCGQLDLGSALVVDTSVCTLAYRLFYLQAISNKYKPMESPFNKVYLCKISINLQSFPLIACRLE